MTGRLILVHNIAVMNQTYAFGLAGVLLVCCALLMYYHVKAKDLLNEMWAVKTYSAAELRGLCKGDFDAIVEVEGAVSCDKPLTSFVTGIPCCWLHVKVTREQERRGGLISAITSDSKTVHDTEWLTEMDRTHSAIFKVEDKTGYTLVNPEGADIEATKVFDGVVTKDVSWLERLLTPASGRYHVVEEVFIPTGYAYVLGQATSVGDDVMVHYPGKGYIDPTERFFVINRSTERELGRYRAITVGVCFWFGILAFLGSVFFLLEGLGLVRLI